MRCYILFLCLILTTIGFGCQSSSSQSAAKLTQRALKINITHEPQTLDPRKARDLKCQTIARMLFEGLVRMGREEKIELALAQSVDVSSDLKTYTFHLKDSIWSNGDAVTSFDFVHAWKKMLSADFPCETAFHLYVIKNAKAIKEGKMEIGTLGAKALDSKTLAIELENPTPYFLELLAIPAFFPVNQRVDEETASWMQNVSTFVCNGPFQLSEWRNQDHLTLVKNDKYWDAPSVKLTSIELEMLEPETELMMFEKNDLDWAGSPLGNLPVDALATLKKSSSLKSKEMLGTYFIRVNTEKGVLKQASMRKALAMAIDRQAIVEHIVQGNQLPATGLVPASLNIQKEPYFRDADLENAKKLFSEALAASHLKKEDLSDLSFVYPSSERSHLIAQALQQQWFEAFGIRVKLEAAEPKVYLERISKQDYCLSIGSWTADFPDPINFLEIFKYKNGEANNTRWENSQFAALLEKSSQIADASLRREILGESEKILMEEMPIIPVFYYSMLYVNQPQLKDVVLSPMGQIDFRWASIAQGDEK